MEIVWTTLAKITYFETLENLKARWAFNEVQEFHDLTNAVLNKIKFNKVEFPTINDELKIKKTLIRKNVSLYFQMEIHGQKIYLVCILQ